MASAVRSDKSPSFAVESDRELEFSSFNRKFLSQKSTTPTRRQRPRTRSLVLKTANHPDFNTPKRKKNKASKREGSPIIDLTAEEDTENAKVDDESPLRFTKRHQRSSAQSKTHSDQHGTQEVHEIDQHEPHTLNLSPIKRAEHIPPTRPLQFSSPLKRRKFVTFSDDLLPSSPVRPMETPRKSILKNPMSSAPDLSPLDPNNTALWAKPAPSFLHLLESDQHSPNNPDFWQPGTIIQLDPKSKDLPQLVDGCIEVIQLENFTRKFEVYATLNQVCKFNDPSILLELFMGQPHTWLDSIELTNGYKPKSNSSYIEIICRCLKRDILDTEKIMLERSDELSKNDPFQSRVLSQALRLSANLLATLTVNGYIPASDVQWLYGHACHMIVSPTISKSLLLPYLAVIKDCHFSSKKRVAIFESGSTPLLEKMLLALLNLRSFPSSSLVNERLLMLKNLIQNFPSLMAKNFHLWYSTLVINLCDTSFPLYTKVVSMGISALLEAARNYLDNTDVCFAGRKFLEFPLPESQRSFTSDKFVSMTTQNSTLTIDYVIESLTELIRSGCHKLALDIWVGVTLLCGKFERGMENWRYLPRWLLVHKSSFNESDILAKVTAISSWKVIIYKLCCYDLRDVKALSISCADKEKVATPDKSRPKDPLRAKTKLLIHIFVNITAFENQQEIIDALHYAFLSILYNLLNYQPKTSSKYLHYFWDKIIQPVLANFYFRKGSSTSYMHKLGASIIDRLIRPSSHSEKPFSNVRCLSNETVSLTEINSLYPRWIFVRFDRVMQILAIVFKLNFLDVELKLTLLNNFFNDLKFSTKKEVQPSDTTFDIIDNLPLTLEVLCKQNKISYDSLFKLVVNLNDTFCAQNMIYDGGVEMSSSYEVLLKNTIQYFTSDQLNSIITMIHGAIGEKNGLAFVYQLLRINRVHHRGDLDAYVGDWLNGKKFNKLTSTEMLTAGRMFELLQQDYAFIAKKLIQHIVLLKAGEFEKMVEHLGIVKWSIPIFKFFISLMHDAPYDHLKHTTLNLICVRWERESCFVDLFGFLVESGFDKEVTNSFSQITQKLATLDAEEKEAGLKILKDYLSTIEDESVLDELIVQSLHDISEIPELLEEQWRTLPKTKEFLNEKGLAVSAIESEATENPQLEALQPSDKVLLQEQNELDNFIAKEMRSHLSEEEIGEVDKPEKHIDSQNRDTSSSDVEIIENIEHKKEHEEQSDPAEAESEESNISISISQSEDDSQISNPSPPRRRTRRMAAREREQQTVLNQQVVDITSDDKPGVAEDVHKFSEHKDDSDPIEDSLENSSRGKKRKASLQVEQKLKKGKQEKPSSEETKQVSDSDESLKKALARKQILDHLQVIDSSTDLSEKHGGTNSQANSSDKKHEKMGNDSFLNSSSESINFQAQSTDPVKPTDNTNSLPAVSEEPHLEDTKQEEPLYDRIINFMNSVNSTHFSEMTSQQKYDVESSMMRFMLRMRETS